MQWKTSGQLKRIENSNQTAAEFTYDPYRLWMNTAIVTGPGNSTLYQASYGYDEAGRVTAMASPTLQYNLVFTYDDLNRLRTISGAQEQTFKYDPVGGIAHNSLLGAYSYTDPAHPHAVTNAAGETYQYDENGNMLSGNGRTLLWDDQNRLQSVTRGGATTTFAYNDRGNRITKEGPNGTTNYFSGLIEVVNGALVKYIYAGPMLVAKKEVSGSKYWYHSDHLGSVRLITNESGSQNPNVITENKYQYAAYGETISQSGALANEKGFTGHTTDPETGLIYMGARYYDANLGRFISADTIVPEPSNPQAFNRFSYCMNNPISNTDPTGHAAFAVPLFSAVLVAASEAASTYVIATAFIGAGLSIAGYCMRNPLLSTLGAVMLGFAGGCVMPGAGGMAGGLLGGGVAGATSPISPLDSGVKEAIGWAYMAYGMIRCFGVKTVNSDIGGPDECTYRETAEGEWASFDNEIDGVKIKFGNAEDGTKVPNKINKALYEKISNGIKSAKLEHPHDFFSIEISATINDHAACNPHTLGWGIDINRINGVRLETAFSNQIKSIMDITKTLHYNLVEMSNGLGYRVLSPIDMNAVPGYGITFADWKQHYTHLHYSQLVR